VRRIYVLASSFRMLNFGWPHENPTPEQAEERGDEVFHRTSERQIRLRTLIRKDLGIEPFTDREPSEAAT
jgi:hypothetical protein